MELRVNITDKQIERIALMHVKASLQPEPALASRSAFRFFRDKIRLFIDFDPGSVILEIEEENGIAGCLIYTFDEPAFNRFCSPAHIRFWTRALKTLVGYYGCDIAKFAKFAKAAMSMLGRERKEMSFGKTLPERYGKIWVLIVAEERRGRGIAGRLLKKCVEAMREKGGDPLIVTVKTDNEPAIKAYEKAGFKKIGVCDESSGRSCIMILER